MITISNYNKQNIPANLPANLAEGHKFITGETSGFKHIDLYNDDATIKAAIDKHIAELNTYLAQSVTKTPKTVIKKVESVTKAENQVELLPLEIQVIKRYLALNNKTKTRKQIMQLLDFIQKAIIDKRIKKANPYAENVDDIQKLLIKVYNGMVESKHQQVLCEIVPERLKALTEIVSKYEALKSVPLIKRYIALDGEFNSKEKVQKLYTDIARFLDKTKGDKYEANLLEIAARLKKYLDNNENKLSIDEATLGSILWAKYARKALTAGKLAKDAISRQYQKAKPHIQSISKKVKDKTSEAYHKLDEKLKQKEVENLKGVEEMFVTPTIENCFKLPTIELKGDLGKLIGKIEQNKLAISLEGDQGAGKSQLMFQLADAFSEVGKNVAVFSLEMPVDSIPAITFINQYVSPANKNKIKWANEAPEGLLSIKKAAEFFDVIFIDSWGKLKVKSEEFDNLRKEHPNTIFIVIFQRTTGNKIRGGTEPLYDAGINIEVVKVDDTFVNNYAKTTKNRYTTSGLKYNISKQQLIS